MNAINFITPLGPMIACANEQGICLLEFADQPNLERQLNKVKKKLTTEIVYAQHPQLTELEQQLNEYFNGKRKTFSLPLNPLGTDFQHCAWNELINIPYAETRSYTQQAIAVGNPAAVRAVARANSMNLISILIPCHRVIGANGTLTGYAGGVARKKWLLDMEKKTTTTPCANH